jgi:putative endonuclease
LLFVPGNFASNVGVMMSKMQTVKMQTGSDGENAAADYLTENGYEVVERNYRYKRAEIDIIVRKKNWLVFVEVKTRSNSDYGFPEEFVDKEKVKNIFLAAEEYMYRINWPGNVRYDIVAILGTGFDREIRHFEDAFY